MILIVMVMLIVVIIQIDCSIQKQPATNCWRNGIKHFPKGALNYGTLVDLYKDGLTKYFNGDGKGHGTYYLILIVLLSSVCVSVLLFVCQFLYQIASVQTLTLMMLPTPQYDTFCPLSNFCAYGLCASQYQYISSVCILHIYHSFEPEKSPCVCMKIRLAHPALLSFTAVCITECGRYSVLACTLA